MFVKGCDAVILHTVEAQHIQLTVNVYCMCTRVLPFCHVYSLLQPDKNGKGKAEILRNDINRI